MNSKKKKVSTFQRYKELASPEWKILLFTSFVQIIQVLGQLLGPAYIGAVIHLLTDFGTFYEGGQFIFINFGCYFLPNGFNCADQKTFMYVLVGEYFVTAVAVCFVTFGASTLKRFISQVFFISCRFAGVFCFVAW